MKGFFVRWLQGTRSYAGSPLGVVHTQLIINFFIVFGLFLGAWQQRLKGEGVIAFILFSFGLLTFISLKSLWKQYKVLERQERIRRALDGFR